MEPKDMDDIYRAMDPADIPWNKEGPPEALSSLVEGGVIRPCRAIDLGCGTGAASVYLAERGFEVTGVDVSPAAVDMARRRAEAAGVGCEFVVADLIEGSGEVRGPFGFAYEWEVLHHIFPIDRPSYVETVGGLLGPGGRYFSVCFHESNPNFGGAGKVRDTRIGTRLYFSSELELRELFSPLFIISELKTMVTPGVPAPHVVNYALMERRG